MSPDLKGATDRLTAKVDELTHTITVSQLQARRTRILLRAATVLTVACVLGLVAMGVLIAQAVDANRSNHDAQVVSCQNANDSRQATLTLWQFLIGQSKADSQKEKVALQKLDTWITQLYAPHDCSQLDKKYPLPPPPKLNL